MEGSYSVRGSYMEGSYSVRGSYMEGCYSVRVFIYTWRALIV